LRYRSEIDGLRAIAVISVIFCHSGFSIFSGGFVGVDIFFVISGYLITTILISEYKAENFSIIQFYERRLRRIFPALFFVVLITIPFAYALLLPDELINFSKSLSAVSLFVSNIFFWKDDNYFAIASGLKPLLHTWSLAVEEQFYILFPIFLMIFWRFGKKFIFITIFLLIIFSLATAQVGAIFRPIPNFFLLPTRLWEIAIGALVALLLLDDYFSRVGLKNRQLLSFLGVLLISIAIFKFDSQTLNPSIYTLLPTLGTALIIIFAEQNTFVGRLLSVRVLVGTGIISYSLYLWHQPVLAFSRMLIPSIGYIEKIILIVLIFILSIISWKYVESPFRKKNLFNRKFIFISSISISIIFCLFGIWSYKSISNLNPELTLAKELANSIAIYNSNMNERNFIKYRIKVETLSPEMIILGSSRAMQIGSHNSSNSVLNLSVSGASLEDILATWNMASTKFAPNLVLIGADPWLFNSKSGQDRWKSLEREYYSALLDLEIKSEKSQTAVQKEDEFNNSFLLDFYKSIYISKIKTLDESPQLINKIRRDGSRVYNISYSNDSNEKIEKNIERYALWSMDPYENSAYAEMIFEKFLSRLKTSNKVVLALSPYHPKLYQFMATKDDKFIKIENEFRYLAKKLGIQVIGSYDPEKVGCINSEFYDGMHPKSSCMRKIMNQIN